MACIHESHVPFSRPAISPAILSSMAVTVAAICTRYGVLHMDINADGRAA